MELSMSDLRELLTNEPSRHPYHGRRVLAVMPHGFIHFGLLHHESGGFRLTDASNLRYWTKRDGGLPEFASKGPKSNDRIDKIGEVALESPLFFYPLGDWSE